MPAIMTHARTRSSTLTSPSNSTRPCFEKFRGLPSLGLGVGLAVSLNFEWTSSSMRCVSGLGAAFPYAPGRSTKVDGFWQRFWGSGFRCSQKEGQFPAHQAEMTFCPQVLRFVQVFWKLQKPNNPVNYPNFASSDDSFFCHI